MNIYWIVSCASGLVLTWAFLYSLMVIASRADDAAEQQYRKARK
jgi:hypothetical protein